MVNLFGDFNLADILNDWLNSVVGELLTAITNFIYGMIGFFLQPIDNIITNYLPDFGNVLQMVNGFFDFIGDFVVWALSWFNIPTAFFLILIGWIVAKLLISFNIHVFKLVIAWWRSLAP